MKKNFIQNDILESLVIFVNFFKKSSPIFIQSGDHEMNYEHMNKTLSAVNTEMICKKIHLLAARAELKAAI